MFWGQNLLWVKNTGRFSPLLYPAGGHNEAWKVGKAINNKSNLAREHNCLEIEWITVTLNKGQLFLIFSTGNTWQPIVAYIQSGCQQQAPLLFTCSMLKGFKLVLRWRLKALLLHCGFLMRDHSDQNVRCKRAQLQICTQNSLAGNQKYMPWCFLFSKQVRLWNGGRMMDWEKPRSSSSSHQAC